MVMVRLSASNSTVSTLPEKPRFSPARILMASRLLMPSISAQSTAPLYSRLQNTSCKMSSASAALPICIRQNRYSAGP